MYVCVCRMCRMCRPLILVFVVVLLVMCWPVVEIELTATWLQTPQAHTWTMNRAFIIRTAKLKVYTHTCIQDTHVGSTVFQRAVHI